MEFVSIADKRNHFCRFVYRMRDILVMRLHSTSVSYIMHSHPSVEVGSMRNFIPMRRICASGPPIGSRLSCSQE